MIRETDPTSMEHDRLYVSAVKVMKGRGVLVARLVIVGHVQFEIGQICLMSLLHHTCW